MRVVLFIGILVVLPCSSVRADLISASRITTWNPGIPGGIPTVATVHTTLDAGDYDNGGSDASGAINSAIDSAGASATEETPLAVVLSAGSWRADYTINVDQDYVVLRGSGPGVTILRSNAAQYTTLINLGRGADWGGEVNVVGSIAKGASSFEVASGHGIEAGDLIVLDQVDDSDVILGGGAWWKRMPGNSDNGPESAEGYRSRGQVIDVGSVASNVITLADNGIVHRAHPSGNTPQVFQSTNVPQGTRGSGVENLTVTGWDGNWGISMRWCAKCWVQKVEFRGDGAYPTDGMDFSFDRCVRSEIRKSYSHHSDTYVPDRHSYGLGVQRQSSDCLIEDNIVFRKNKNIVLEASGPGNVIAYNYVDDPVIGSTGNDNWMEVGIDGSHLSCPGFDLIEGNYTARMGAADTHGNADYQTFFRNYSVGDRPTDLTEPCIAWTVTMFCYGMHNMNIVGNVLGEPDPPGTMVYTITPSGEPPVYSYGDIIKRKVFFDGVPSADWEGTVDLTVASTMLLLYNWDTVREQIDTDPEDPLIDSYYLSSKPAFFGSYTWPWVDPEGGSDEARVLVLPAKARYDAADYFGDPPGGTYGDPGVKRRGHMGSIILP